MGLLKNDSLVILDAVYKLSEQLGLEPTLNVMIAEIVLDKFNPDSVEGEKVRGSVIKSAKMLVQHFFPDFCSEILDDILHVIIKMNPESLEPICKRLDIPVEIITIASSFLSENKSDILDNIKSLPKKILPKQYCKFYSVIKSVQN